MPERITLELEPKLGKIICNWEYYGTNALITHILQSASRFMQLSDKHLIWTLRHLWDGERAFSSLEPWVQAQRGWDSPKNLPLVSLSSDPVFLTPGPVGFFALLLHTASVILKTFALLLPFYNENDDNSCTVLRVLHKFTHFIFCMTCQGHTVRTREVQPRFKPSWAASRAQGLSGQFGLPEKTGSSSLSACQTSPVLLPYIQKLDCYSYCPINFAHTAHIFPSLTSIFIFNDCFIRIYHHILNCPVGHV